MTKLSWEQVDQIQTATGENHYYRAFPANRGWIVHIHEFNTEGVPGSGQPVGTTTFERAQEFAQAFEDVASQTRKEAEE